MCVKDFTHIVNRVVEYSTNGCPEEFTPSVELNIKKGSKWRLDSHSGSFCYITLVELKHNYINSNTSIEDKNNSITIMINEVDMINFTREFLL